MNYTIKKTSWKEDKQALSQIRKNVFIEEQNVPEALEWDEFDDKCIHILITQNTSPVACGRIKPDGHIGRMAVLKEHRRAGIGTAILNELLESAKQNKNTKVYLHAQTSAIAFYEKLGFNISSEEFMDANIPHRTMEKRLNSTTMK